MNSVTEELIKKYSYFQNKVSHAETKQSNKWFMGQVEVALELSQLEIEFVRKYNLQFSTQHVGMVKCYYKNKTIWQISNHDDLFTHHNKYDRQTINYRDLINRTKAFLNRIMKMSEKELIIFLSNTEL
jgi:hypothetical protein